MTKVYIIIRDKKSGNILVGKGGTSGKRAQPRKGFHLPGGTVDTLKPLDDATILQLKAQMEKELGEEFGTAKGGSLTKTLLVTTPHIFSLVLSPGKKWSAKVYFMVFSIDGADLEAGPVKDGLKNPFDSGFDAVESVTVAAAISDFCVGNGTDWFEIGCNIAKKNKLI